MSKIQWDSTLVLNLAGLMATFAFGIYGIVKGKLQAGQKSTRLIIVLVILYLGQIVSTKLFGQPIIAQTFFSTLIMMLVVWTFWLIRDE